MLSPNGISTVRFGDVITFRAKLRNAWVYIVMVEYLFKTGRETSQKFGFDCDENLKFSLVKAAKFSNMED